MGYAGGQCQRSVLCDIVERAGKRQQSEHQQRSGGGCRIKTIAKLSRADARLPLIQFAYALQQ